jgi:serine/threonine protein kinase
MALSLSRPNWICSFYPFIWEGAPYEDPASPAFPGGPTRWVKPGGAGDSDEDSDEGASTSSSDNGEDDIDSDGDGDGGPRKLAAMTMEEVTNELIMMQQLSGHPNIVTVKEFFTEGAANTPTVTPSAAAAAAAAHHVSWPDEAGNAAGNAAAGPEEGTVHVVMELLRGQELVDAITEVGTYAESDAKLVMSNMLDAIAFMHARGVVHRDLKLENLVLSRPNDLSSVTLVDFGLAKALMARERAENVCGTLAYVAPEALAAGQYGQGVDVWALGVAMHALLTGTWPFDNEDEDELMDSIIECDLDFDEGEEWAGISPEAKDLLGGLLDPNPKHRLSAAQALEHAWFTGQRQNTSERLHHVHARLDALVGSSRQHPVGFFCRRLLPRQMVRW